MSKIGLLVTLVILLIVGFGAFVYTKDPSLLNIDTIIQKIKGEPKEEVIVVSLPEALPSKVSIEEMQKLALGPVKGAKEAELQKFSETVNEASVISEVLDISSCNTPIPNILSFSPTQLLTIVNRDTLPHYISVFFEDKYVILSNVAPQSQNKMVINILKPGIYSYVCDNVGPAGMFLVQ